MLKAKRIREFQHREFSVVIAQVGDTFKAVGRDNQNNQVTEISADSAEAVEQEIKQALNPLSNDFVSIEGAINLFKRVFPDGFGSAFYDHIEGDYKADGVKIVAEHFSEIRLTEDIAAGKFDGIVADAKRAMSKTNLASPYEIMALADVLKMPGIPEKFSRHLFDLLYGDDFGPAFDRFVKLLTPKKADKWPIVTYFPFFRFPEKHMFVKPEIAQNCAHRLGFDLHYDSKPNMTTYRSCLELADTIREGIASLNPKDNIDIQTFMYVVGKEGYVAEVIKMREEWEKPEEP